MRGVFNGFCFSKTTPALPFFKEGSFTRVVFNRGLEGWRDWGDFVQRTSRLNAYLIAMGVDKTPIYQQFFPLEVTEFTQGTNKTNAESHINRLIAAISANLSGWGYGSIK